MYIQTNVQIYIHPCKHVYIYVYSYINLYTSILIQGADHVNIAHLFFFFFHILDHTGLPCYCIRKVGWSSALGPSPECIRIMERTV